MMKFFLQHCRLALLVFGLVLSSVVPAADISEMTVAFIPKITGNSFFESANAGAQEYARRHGYRVIYMGSPKAEIAEQIKIIEDAVNRGVNAICISSLDASRLDRVLSGLMNKGIVVVTWDSDVSERSRTLMVTQGEPRVLARMLVDMAVQSLIDRGLNPRTDPIRYAWHYSQSYVADQNSWCTEGEKYIASNFPKWVNVHPDNYYSGQDPYRALTVGHQILDDNPDIDLIFCNDSTALPWTLEALSENGLSKKHVTVTGFAAPNAIRHYAKEDLIERWGLWDCRQQGAISTYLAAYLASGHRVRVGDSIDVPGIGDLEINTNDVLIDGARTAPFNNGVVVLPHRLIFTKLNVDNYDF